MLVFLHYIYMVAFMGVDAARILVYLPTPSYSHQKPFHALWRELSIRGHQVTTLTTLPINDSKLINLTEIDLTPVLRSSGTIDVLEMAERSAMGSVRVLYEQMYDIIDAQLGYEPVRALIQGEKGQFDLVLSEYLFATPLAFAKRFGCPSIGFLSVDALNHFYRLIGNPNHPIAYPDFLSGPSDHIVSFIERMQTFVLSLWAEYYLFNYIHWADGQNIAKHFGVDYPTPIELAQNVSLLFLNIDPIFRPIRPLLPSIIPIGPGLHPTSSAPLSEELKATLDGATNGFIYFSLGSNVQSEFFPEETLQIFVSVFAELPYKVLWKFGLETLPNKSDNVIISKWISQLEVLKHPNIKLFITQGGLQSIDEAMYAHVPIIGLPVIADQPYNVRNLARRGCGLMLDIKNLSKAQLKGAILEVINNPRYRNNVKRLAELARDQPMTGMERAVWWIEYVLRNKGAEHLQSPLLNMPWYQYYILDVIAVFGVIAYIMLFILVKICKFLWRSKSKEKQH